MVYNKCQDAIAFLKPDHHAGLDPGLSEKAKGKRRELTTHELALAAAGAGAVASFVLLVQIPTFVYAVMVTR